METTQPRAPTGADFKTQPAAWQLLHVTLPSGAVPHAILITGMDGVGKRTLANIAARTLLCRGEKKPCGVCPSCIQLDAGMHPDLTVIRPGEPISARVEKGRKGIPVDDIREAVRIAGEHAYEGGWRVIIIEQAETMNANAQNALLKTLEEAQEQTCFFLLSESPGLLLTTVVSRCREIRLHPWPEETVRRILTERGVDAEKAAAAAQLSGGSIRRGLDKAGDETYWERRGRLLRDFFDAKSRSELSRISAEWKETKGDAESILDDLEDMVRLLIHVRLGREDAGLLREYPEAWRKAASQGDLRRLLALMDAIARAKALRLSQVNWQATLEQLLLRFMEEKNRW